MDIEVRSFSSIRKEEVSLLAPLVESTLGEWDEEWFLEVVKNHPIFQLFVAFDGNTPVGFKIGYEIDKWKFYSWLGGVVEEYQGRGIAKSLMKEQHLWCKSQGYMKVRTKTLNKFRNMLVLNIKSGFEVIGTYQTETDGTKIILEKKI